ncbi:MAG: lysozyme [Sphingobacteriales bacterium]|nr:MAG: lysozyme [Sphingobacteriales bacterium]
MAKVTNISNNCLRLIEHFECGGNVNQPKWLNAYKDVAGVWTIGIGTIRYPNGKRVKQGDTCTVQEAYEWLMWELKETMLMVDALTTDTINQQQFDALVSFTYNVGSGNYSNSTLRKLINNNPNDYTNIVPQFLKWKYADGVESAGLLRRRKAEAYLYVHGELKFYYSLNDTII